MYRGSFTTPSVVGAEYQSNNFRELYSDLISISRGYIYSRKASSKVWVEDKEGNLVVTARVYQKHVRRT